LQHRTNECIVVLHFAGSVAQESLPRVLAARSSLAGFACRSGALMLAHALFPDHTHHLLAWLAVPVALADSLGVVAAAAPAGAQQAVRSKAQQFKSRLQKQPCGGIGWVDGVQGLVEGSLHTFRSLSGAPMPHTLSSGVVSAAQPHCECGFAFVAHLLCGC
jgi:hypothetical protein